MPDHESLGGTGYKILAHYFLQFVLESASLIYCNIYQTFA